MLSMKDLFLLKQIEVDQKWALNKNKNVRNVWFYDFFFL